MKIALIIPAYKPDEKLLALMDEVLKRNQWIPVVIDDGSGEDYERIFDALPAGVTLLRHPQNRGKGAALKTGMRYILENLPECIFAVTADADGQHRPEDIQKVTERIREKPYALVMGSRAFSGKVPFRSILGNGITRQVYSAASGVRIYDTQTGLRAFGRKAMSVFSEIPGDRYEYEINMLLEAARQDIEIIEVPIKTVYLDDNASSHFNALHDSARIYRCILKYARAEVLGWLLEMLALAGFLMVPGLEPFIKVLTYGVVFTTLGRMMVKWEISRRIYWEIAADAARPVLSWGLVWLLRGAAHWSAFPAVFVAFLLRFLILFFAGNRFATRKNTLERAG